MEKMTKKQITAINHSCSNEWKFDVPYFVYHSEKTLIKRFRVDEESYLEFRLYYNSKNQVELHIGKFYHKKDDDFSSTEGLGKNKVLNETSFKRRTINNLITYTHQLSDEELNKINEQTKVTPSSGLFLQSEEF